MSNLEEEELETKPQTGSIGGESSDEDRWEMPAEGDGVGKEDVKKEMVKAKQIVFCIAIKCDSGRWAS